MSHFTILYLKTFQVFCVLYSKRKRAYDDEDCERCEYLNRAAGVDEPFAADLPLPSESRNPTSELENELPVSKCKIEYLDHSLIN